MPFFLEWFAVYFSFPSSKFIRAENILEDDIFVRFYDFFVTFF